MTTPKLALAEVAFSATALLGAKTLHAQNPISLFS